MREIEDKSIDLVITDPPFGTTQNEWDVPIPFPPMWEQICRIKKENAAIIFFGLGMFTAELMASNKKRWKYNLIWDKETSTGFLNANKMPLREHEDIIIFYGAAPVYNPQWGAGPKTHGRSYKNKDDVLENNYGNHHQTETDISLGHAKHPTSILKFKPVTANTRLHPTEKPVPLLEYLIKTYSNVGDVVLDFCIGSGSTAEASIRTGRQFIGFEKEQSYYDAASIRIKKAQEQGKISGWFE
jgi:DNA modification methylase